MEILWNVLLGLGAALFGYLLGAIPTGVVIGKVFYHVDPRDYGSHASGGTNSGRVFGKRVGIIVIVLDILKAVIAFWACWAIVKFTPIIEASWLFDHGDIFPWIASVGVAFGHCWPVFLQAVSMMSLKRASGSVYRALISKSCSHWSKCWFSVISRSSSFR